MIVPSGDMGGHSTADMDLEPMDPGWLVVGTLVGWLGRLSKQPPAAICLFGPTGFTIALRRSTTFMLLVDDGLRA